ncbi:MAG TPA: hypothetical protein VMS17_08200 [Gemmataceae bacterium]|nr:hypothetical protein [Gemmataceae bacterium]
MSGPFIDLNAPSLRGQPPMRPAELPHGPVAPPQRVLEIVAQQEERLLRESGIVPAAEARRRLIDDLTLQYFFDGLGHEVLYRSTPAGPEVLAVGLDEILAVRRATLPEEQPALKTWLP